VLKPRTFVLLFVAVSSAAHADWKVLSVQSEPGRAGLEHRHVVLENPTADGRADLDVAVFSDRSCTLRLIDNPNGESLAAMMKHEKCACAVNGGYFDENFQPIGLRIVDGRMVAPLRRARLITGVLLASSRGIRIMRVSEFSPHQKTAAAIQCGPLLVDSLHTVRGLNDSAMARRTFAATAPNGRGLIGLCSEISLAQLGNLLAATPLGAELKIQRALNLDGGSSSAFWFAREQGGDFSISEAKSVRDFVAVVPK
jgi:exopolysaccharide biosynthesis protein